MTTSGDLSPGGSSFASPLSFVHPRHKNRTTYVQRWKVLRDRNKNLPKLDFNEKATGMPKKILGPGSFSRSHTYDSMKLPSISTCSIVTGVSAKTVHSDGYRRRDLTNKKNLQEQHSESYTDLSTQREYRNLAAALSKSLQSLAADDSISQKGESSSKTSNNNRYESISYKKHLLKRHKTVEPTDKTKRSKGVPVKGKTEKDQFQKLPEKEFVLVKSHTKMQSPFLLDKRDKTEETYKKANKSFSHSVNYPTSPPTEDYTKRSDTVTVTPDNVTIHSPLTYTSSNVTNPQYPINIYTPFLHGTV
ncbi:uncharacterized protein LOC123566308 isoform X2 [Mercenaria mercenaria]|uniref:uncharacterized protein LOC123566308 isoform X2 n=1 Tax=Mercenaria mercenaria TaxID=6596 RepID=UPI00234F0356|nr:uncharacterized protein LOC123566308 isoform X2 [Mercenaria mercenaria]